MHPAYSVIFFTTASGAGYGLLFWLGLGHAAGLLAHDTWLFLVALTLSLALATAGLLSSTLHLGHPERAWRAFSQWRSSWLSREGVAAVATYAPSGLLWLASATGTETAVTRPLAALAALGAVATVHCTGMIYASLRTIRQWNLRLVPALYHALSAATGALLLATLLALSGERSSAPLWLALVALALAAALKLAWFRAIDADPGRYSAAMALGLQADSVRQLDPPHTRPNFVMREMGYAIGRKHAAKLRRVALFLLFAIPLTLLLTAILLPGSGPWLLPAALTPAAVGLVVERWLFFAEAEHVSMLYYGRDRA